jgi:hypothetical protein
MLLYGIYSYMYTVCGLGFLPSRIATIDYALLKVAPVTHSNGHVLDRLQV